MEAFIAQIESLAGLDAIDGIAVSTGSTACCSEPADSSVSLGIPGQFSTDLALLWNAVKSLDNTLRGSLQ